MLDRVPAVESEDIFNRICPPFQEAGIEHIEMEKEL